MFTYYHHSRSINYYHVELPWQNYLTCPVKVVLEREERLLWPRCWDMAMSAQQGKPLLSISVRISSTLLCMSHW